MNYKNHYDALINRAKGRILDGYKECHHILPRCMGGTDDISNLVNLTPEEHYVAHQLLVKIYPTEYKLVFAVNVMTGKKKNRPCAPNKCYGWIKRRVSIARKMRPPIKQTPESIAKRVAKTTGKKRTDEQRLNLSKGAQTRKPAPPISEETRNRMRIAQSGKTYTEEQNKRNSESKIGRKPSYGNLGKAQLKCSCMGCKKVIAANKLQTKHKLCGGSI